MAETKTRTRGFVRSLFLGELDTDTFLPFPTQEPEAAETTREIVSMVGEWARDAVDPEQIDQQKVIPDEVVEGLKELGLFGLTIPEEYGGAGMGQATYARVMETVAHRCASTVTILGAHLGIGMKGLLLYGTPEQRERWLPDLASGERIAAFALTEAGAGSDAAAVRTRADRTDQGFRLNGRKIWITNASVANLYTVFARTAPDGAPDTPLMERPMSAFVVPRTEGVTPGVPENKMGLCGSNTVELGFEDVDVDADALLGPDGDGFKVAMNILNAGRHGLAACCIGQARLARDLALAHAHERHQFGRPTASFGMVQEMLANMEADLYAMEAGTWLTAGLVDRGHPDTMLEAACCKMFATEKLWSIANDALQVTGGTGFMREYAYERIVRDARINLIFEGTNQVLRLMLGSQGLRAMVRGEAQPGEGPVQLMGVSSELEREARRLEVQVPLFAAYARDLVEKHGSRVRQAQLALKRISDMAVALFGQCAVLSRASEELGRGEASSLNVARLACRRLERDFRAALADPQEMDPLVSEVAQGMKA